MVSDQRHDSVSVLLDFQSGELLVKDFALRAGQEGGNYGEEPWEGQQDGQRPSSVPLRC